MATNSKQLVIDFGFDSKASSNIAGDLRVTGNVVANGSFSANTFVGDLIPDQSLRNLGNTTNRWVVYSSSIIADGAFSVSNTASLGNTSITGFANVSTSVNSALLTVGTSFIANTLGAYHTGIVNAASHSTSGFVANTTAITPTSNSVLLGNSIGRFVLSANSGDFSGTVSVAGNATLSGTLQVISGNSNFDSGVLFVDSINNRVGVNNTAPTVALEVAGSANISTSVNSALLTVGSNFIANTSGVYHTGTINAASHTIGSNFIANSTAIVGTGFANISTSVNSALLTVGTNFIANTTALVSTGFANISTSVNSALLTVGTNFIANTTGAYHTGTINASSLTVGSANVGGALVVSTTASLGNTTVLGFANVSTSVNSALLTVGTSFIANTLGVYHTGTVNAASYTTAGFVANTTAITPTSNTILLGNSIGRFVLSANSGDFSGAITGISVNSALITVGSNFIANSTALISTGFANIASSVNSAVLRVGNSFIANTSQITIAAGVPLSANGDLGSSGQVLLSNGATGSPYWGVAPAGAIPATYVQNTDSRTLSGNLVISGTYFNPSANTILLGNSISRWVVSANTGDFSGNLSVTGNTTLSGAVQTVMGNTNFDSGVLFVDSVNNRVGVNNTAPTVALEVAGSANISTSVNSALLTVGTSFIANTLGAYHTGIINAASHTIGSNFIANSTAIVGTGFANISTSVNSALLTVGTSFIANSTAIVSTGFANISTSVNSALLTVGTSFIANTLGAYHTGTINAASHTIGSAFVANTTGAYHTGTVQAAIFNSTSDINSKYNIKTIENPISKVMNMRGVTFTWRHSDVNSMGLIAQEVEKVIPEVVNTDIEGKKSISYDNIIGLLVEAIKHQQNQIDSLIANKVTRDGN